MATSVQVAVTAQYGASGPTADVTDQATYSVADESVATVDDGGNVTVAAGASDGASTTMTVAYGGETADVPVTVTAP
jgi:hypothetical protein